MQAVQLCSSSASAWRVSTVPRARVAAQFQPSRRNLRCSAAVDVLLPVNDAPAEQPIALTDKAKAHLLKLKAENDNPGSLLLRVGVKQGGCSGMSYVMDFEARDKVSEDDTIAQYDGELELVIDPKSLLYLFGMNLDYSDALIGGGFKFNNPNATDSCGCGKSFGV